MWPCSQQCHHSYNSEDLLRVYRYCLPLLLEVRPSSNSILLTHYGSLFWWNFQVSLAPRWNAAQQILLLPSHHGRRILRKSWHLQAVLNLQGEYLPCAISSLGTPSQYIWIRRFLPIFDRPNLCADQVDSPHQTRFLHDGQTPWTQTHHRCLRWKGGRENLPILFGYLVRQPVIFRGYLLFRWLLLHFSLRPIWREPFFYYCCILYSAHFLRKVIYHEELHRELRQRSKGPKPNLRLLIPVDYKRSHPTMSPKYFQHVDCHHRQSQHCQTRITWPCFHSWSKY